MADWQGVVIDGRLYSEAGAIALEHVRRGAGPVEMATLMGYPPERHGHRGWLCMHHHYARHIAEGPADPVSTS